MILGLFTELSTIGGIEQVNRHTCAVLSSYAQSHNYHYKFLAVGREKNQQVLQANGRSFAVHGFQRNKRAYTIACLRQLRHKPRYVYVGHVNLAPVALLLKKINPKLVFSVACHGSAEYGRLAFWRRYALQQADIVLPVSRILAEKVRDIHGVRNERIHILPPPLEQDWLDPKLQKTKKKPDLPPGRILLTVGRLDSRVDNAREAHDKCLNVEGVIKALPQVLSVFPDIYYVVIGDGTEKDYLVDFARRQGLGQKVLFLGSKRGADLRSYYQHCNIYVMPSLWEGFGIVFLEAMAQRKPVIGSISGGASDLIVEGKTGFLINPDDSQGLANRIITLINNSELCFQMGEAGYQRLLDCYTFKAYENRLIELIESYGLKGA